MRHQGFQWSAAAAMVGLAILMAFDPIGTSWASPPPNQLRRQLHAEVQVALDRSTLTDVQKAEFLRCGRELQQLARLRRAGQRVDRVQMEMLGCALRDALDSGAFLPQDRERIYQLLREVRTAQTEAQLRARRESFVAQFGLPLGLLAEWVASQHGPIPQGS